MFIAPLLFMLLFWGAVIGGAGWLLVRLLRAQELRSRNPLAVHGMDERVRQLEDTMRRLETEIEELGASQRFTTRLLTERAGMATEPLAAPPPRRATLPPPPRLPGDPLPGEAPAADADRADDDPT